MKHNKMRQEQFKTIKRGKKIHNVNCIMNTPSVCEHLERPHACTEGWSSVGWCDSDVQVVSDLEALGLQCHGVICAFPA